MPGYPVKRAEYKQDVTVRLNDLDPSLNVVNKADFVVMNKNFAGELFKAEFIDLIRYLSSSVPLLNRSIIAGLHARDIKKKA